MTNNFRSKTTQDLVRAAFPRRRRGAFVHEAILAIVLSGVIMAGISQLVGLALQQRSSARQRFVARHELSNLMEEAMSLPWAEVTTEGLAAAKLDELTPNQLPGAQVQCSVAEEGDSARRIQIQLSWPARHASQRQSLALVGWRYKAEEEHR